MDAGDIFHVDTLFLPAVEHLFAIDLEQKIKSIIIHNLYLRLNQMCYFLHVGGGNQNGGGDGGIHRTAVDPGVEDLRR